MKSANLRLFILEEALILPEYHWVGGWGCGVGGRGGRGGVATYDHAHVDLVQSSYVCVELREGGAVGFNEVVK